ncbi:hypothetical protein QJQ45_014125 [Haematococcus lacustris]|nr:hypothetical protein QJQ45_014125 [Haematococcus lacustris]
MVVEWLWESVLVWFKHCTQSLAQVGVAMKATGCTNLQSELVGSQLKLQADDRKRGNQMLEYSRAAGGQAMERIAAYPSPPEARQSRAQIRSERAHRGWARAWAQSTPWPICTRSGWALTTVAHEQRDTDGNVVSVWHRTLTAQDCRDSGITRQAQATKTWLTKMKPQLKALSQVKPSSLASYRRFVDTVLETYDAMWARPCHCYKCKEKNKYMQLIKQAKQQWPDRILALGTASFSGNGTIGRRGVLVSQMLKEALKAVPSRASASQLLILDLKLTPLEVLKLLL